MTVPFSTIRDFVLRTPTEEIYLTDMAFLPATGDITHIICDRGGILFGSEVSVPVAALGPCDPVARVWTADMSEDGLDSQSRVAETTSLPIEAMPPTVVGPFGTTQSPILLTAQWLDTRWNGAKARVTEGSERMGDWLGADVFGPAGPLGRIAEFHLDTATMRVREVTVGVAEARYRIVFDALRNFVTEERYAVTDLTQADLDNGMTIAEQGPALPDQPRDPWVRTMA